MALKEFTIGPSEFRDTYNHKKLKYGDHMPTYYRFEVVEDRQYLIVGFSEEVELLGMPYKLQARGDVDIKGMVGLERECTAYKVHKVLTEQGIEERSGR